VVARSKWFFCLADEHYFATVLAVYRHGGKTDCMGHVVAADWSEHTVHPMSFEPENVTTALCVDCRAQPLVLASSACVLALPQRQRAALSWRTCAVSAVHRCESLVCSWYFAIRSTAT